MQGICFTEDLFHATIEGRKTQARRIIKTDGNIAEFPLNDGGSLYDRNTGYFIKYLNPRYKVGETLYIKEPIRLNISEKTLHLKYSDVTIPIELPTNFLLVERFMKLQNRSKTGYYPKMCIPKWIPKDIFRKIEITGVRCERLQDISDSDILNEGIIKYFHIKEKVHKYGWNIGEDVFAKYTPREAYAALIDSINSKGTWDSNPYVWVYDYRLVNKSFDEILEDNKEILKRLKNNLKTNHYEFN